MAIFNGKLLNYPRDVYYLIYGTLSDSNVAGWIFFQQTRMASSGISQLAKFDDSGGYIY